MHKMNRKSKKLKKQEEEKKRANNEKTREMSIEKKDIENENKRLEKRNRVKNGSSKNTKTVKTNHKDNGLKNSADLCDEVEEPNVYIFLYFSKLYSDTSTPFLV